MLPFGTGFRIDWAQGPQQSLHRWRGDRLIKTIAVEDTTLTLDDLAKMAEKEPVILTRNGQPLVAVKDLSGSDWESVSLANHPRFIALIEASRLVSGERRNPDGPDPTGTGVKAPNDRSDEATQRVAGMTETMAMIVTFSVLVARVLRLHWVRKLIRRRNGTRLGRGYHRGVYSRLPQRRSA